MSKKVTEERATYIKNGIVVLEDKAGLFVYEVSVYCRYKNYFSLINKKYYSAHIEIPGTIGSFYKNPHTEICCELFSAPLQWLIDNQYLRYTKPDKKKRTNKLNINTDGESETKPN